MIYNFVALAALVSGAFAHSFTICGADHMGINQINLTPDPVLAGASLSIDVLGTPDVQINSGTLTLTLTAFGAEIADVAFDICTELGVSCPLAANQPFDAKVTFNVPMATPATTIGIHGIAIDGAGSELECLDMSVQVVKRCSKEMLAKMPAVTQAIVDEVNSAKTTWHAALPSRFANATMSDAIHMMGTVMKGEPDFFDLAPKAFAPQAIPTSFDARTNWPQCSALIGTPRDQSACGSCWAFGSAEAISDRLCVKTGSTMMLSAEDVTACCSGLKCSFSAGCNGGQPSGAWSWFESTGLCSGGLYSDVGTGASCKPYEFPPCAHHTDSTEYPPCPSTDYSTPRCTSTCSEGSYKTAYATDKIHAASSYSVKGVSNIQTSIMESGSVTAAFSVYEDFLTYTSGVYQHKTGSYLGGHAIKIIGWGMDGTTAYWICVNSWNESWGDGGTFKILRGSNECGIEGQIVAGDV